MSDALIVRTPVLFPETWSNDRRNFKRQIIVHRDGSFTERILLAVPDARHREYLICLHFLRCLEQSLATELGINFLKRDDPWDFRAELSTGETINIEITAIADNEHRFVTESRQSELARTKPDATISLRRLEKLERQFPDPSVAAHIAEVRAAGKQPSDQVANPYFGEGPTLFMEGMTGASADLLDLVAAAVASKVAKPHAEKSQTVLIIDNRTITYDLPDFRAVMPELDALAAATAFAEIWVYTGYCSDDDGNNAEFTLFSLKTTEARVQAHEARVAERGMDELGRLIF